MIIAAALSYLLPIYVLITRRFPLISPPVFLIIFFNVAYGLHTNFASLMTDSIWLPDETHKSYNVMVVLANAGLALGFATGNILISADERTKMLSSDHARSKPLSRLQDTGPIVWFSLAFSFAFLALDAPQFGRTLENIKFLFSLSEFGYTEIRRELFSEDLITLAQNYVRSGAAVVLVCLISIKLIHHASGPFSRIQMFILLILVYTAGILSLNKLPAIYTLLCIIGSLYLFKTGVAVGLTRKIPHIIGAGVLMLLVLGQLYQLQYGSALERGNVHMSQLEELIFYRPFFAQADKLRFWLDQWPDMQPYLGFRSVGPVAALFGLDYYNPNYELPRIYLGNYLTTWQVGFMGSGYASWGFGGVLGYGLISGFSAVLVTKIVNRLVHRDIAAAAAVVCSMTTFYLTSTELGIALLSGGVVLAPLFAMALDKLFKCRLQRRVGRVGLTALGDSRRPVAQGRDN